MGVIDSTHYRVSCPQCGASDDPRAVQKGSVYGAGHWSGPESDKFDLQLKQTMEGESLIVSARCKKCGAAANVK